MPVKVQKMTRVFEFSGMTLPDPNPEFSVEQVRETYVTAYPELATAAVEGPKAKHGTLTYTFARSIGTKG